MSGGGPPAPSDLAEDLALIREAAILAGEKALSMRAASLGITRKADGTPVSDADLAVDRWLRARLLQARPAYGWLSEETADDLARLARDRVFVVDPIDGTRDYLRARPWWGVSIGVVERGRPICGVFRAPQRNETFEATKGGGALRNAAPIAASPAERLEGAAMLGDKSMFTHPGWPQPWPPMRVESRNSIAYRMCCVASGEFDGALAVSTKSEWDLAAADLIATEAGCIVTDHKGRALAYNRADPRQPSLICAAPGMHRLILQRVEHIDR